MSTGSTVRLLRTAEDLSQTSLAEKLGISRSYLCQIEKGAKEPSLALIQRVARVFGVPTALLVADKSEVAPQLSAELRTIFSSFLAAKIQASAVSSRKGKAAKSPKRAFPRRRVPLSPAEPAARQRPVPRGIQGPDSPLNVGQHLPGVRS